MSSTIFNNHILLMKINSFLNVNDKYHLYCALNNIKHNCMSNYFTIRNVVDTLYDQFCFEMIHKYHHPIHKLLKAKIKIKYISIIDNKHHESIWFDDMFQFNTYYKQRSCIILNFSIVFKI